MCVSTDCGAAAGVSRVIGPDASPQGMRTTVMFIGPRFTLLVHVVVPHCHCTVAVIVNVPNEQNGTHQDGRWLVVQQACRPPAELTRASHVVPVTTGFSVANDGAFRAGAGS